MQSIDFATSAFFIPVFLALVFMPAEVCGQVNQLERDAVRYELTAERIEDMIILYSEEMAEYYISVTLKEEMQAEFAKLTAANIGSILKIVFEDEVLATPVIRVEIDQGRFSFPGYSDKETTEKLVNRIRGDEPE